MMLSDPAGRVVRLIGEPAVTAAAGTGANPAVDEILDRVRARRRGRAGFPAPQAGTSIWYRPAVERWPAGTGRLPGGPAGDRPVLSRDTRF
ncbi:hypothetical protein [Actinoplanes sp. NPDC049802]|uniref:hypothetical protein n=1 Tax=Actinoplanes sp. NPDC049802 TaxID=3154742 RepID=UPI003409B95E